MEVSKSSFNFIFKKEKKTGENRLQNSRCWRRRCFVWSWHSFYPQTVPARAMWSKSFPDTGNMPDWLGNRQLVTVMPCLSSPLRATTGDQTKALSLLHLLSRSGHSLSRMRTRISRLPPPCWQHRWKPSWLQDRLPQQSVGREDRCCWNPWGAMGNCSDQAELSSGYFACAITLEALQWHSQLHSVNMPTCQLPSTSRQGKS